MEEKTEDKAPWIGSCFARFDAGDHDMEKLLDAAEIEPLLNELLDRRDQIKERDKEAPLGKQLEKELGYCRSAARCSTSPLFQYLLHKDDGPLAPEVVDHAIFLLFTWQFEKSKCTGKDMPGPYLAEEDLRALYKHMVLPETSDDTAGMVKEIRTTIRESLYAWKKMKKRMPLATEKALESSTK